MYQRTPQLLVLMLAAHVAAAHDIGHEHEHVEGGWNAKAGFVSDTDITAKLWNPRGKSQAEIDRGFLGENVMRVFAAYWD